MVLHNDFLFLSKLHPRHQIDTYFFIGFVLIFSSLYTKPSVFFYITIIYKASYILHIVSIVRQYTLLMGILT